MLLADLQLFPHLPNAPVSGKAEPPALARNSSLMGMQPGAPGINFLTTEPATLLEVNPL